MEGSIEDRHLRNVWKSSHGDLDTLNVSGVMKRCKRYKFSNLCHYMPVYQDRFIVEFPPVYHTMSDSEQFVRVLQESHFSSYSQYEFETFHVV